jgi:hypothetical protein
LLCHSNPKKSDIEPTDESKQSGPKSKTVLVFCEDRVLHAQKDDPVPPEIDNSENVAHVDLKKVSHFGDFNDEKTNCL